MDPASSTNTKRRRVQHLDSTAITDGDIISMLPDDLIVHILSLLKTEEIIPTGVLSRRWANMWKKVQNLKFNDRDDTNWSPENITSTLVAYQNHFFNSLTISVSYHCEVTDLVIWIGIALAKKVSKLVLRVNQLPDLITFPEYLLRKTNKLNILKLMGNIKFSLTSASVFLDHLTELHLYNVRFENGNSVICLLDGCPVLQDLVLDIYISSGLQIFRISAPSLLRLSLATCNCEGEQFIIQTPRLKHLNIRNFDGVDSLVLEEVPSLVEATILRHYETLDENILQRVTSAKCLYLSAPLTTPRGILFNTLKTLTIDTKPDGWCNLLAYMLKTSPNLQSLKLTGGFFIRWQTTWSQPQLVAPCMLNHLQTIQWDDYIWEAADDIEVATYLIKYGKQLTDVTFTTAEPKTAARINQREAVLAQIANTNRASNSCNIIFKNSSLSHYTAMTDEDPDVEDFIY